MRACLAVLLAALFAMAAGAAPPFARQTIAGSTHEAGETRWSDRLERRASAGCKQTSEDNCVRNAIVVHNESPRPLHCKFRLDHRGGDDQNRKRVEEQRIVFPGEQSEAAVSFAPVAQEPREFSTQCVIVHQPPLVALEVPRECFGEILGPSPEAFYPPASKRRNEQGEVILEFGVKRFSAALVDVLVVGSSGYVALDNAALSYAGNLTQRKHCPGKRYRLKVKFVLTNEDPIRT